MQKIKNSIQNLLNNRFFKDLSIIFSENIVTKSMNFLIILALTRMLGPSDYGKYSFIFVSMAFCSSFFDFGMENTVVRFSAKEKSLKDSIFGLYFAVKLTVLFFIITILLTFGENLFIAMNKAEIITYIPYLVVGILGESLLFINDTYLQAIQKFKLRAAINVSRYFIALSYIFILFINELILLKYVFYLYLIPLIVSLFFIHKYIKFLISHFANKLNKKIFIEIVNYQKWMFNLAIAYNILSKIDFFMLSFWVNYAQIGIYNAAIQLASVVSFLPYVFGKVMLPKMSELNSNEVFAFTKRIFKPLTFMVIAIICCIPLTNVIVPLLLGPEYKESIAILQLLLIAFAISFLTTPFEQAFYSLGKPKIITIGRYIQILLIVILNFLTIPAYGMIWAAINVLITRIVFFIAMIYLFAKEEKLIQEVQYEH